MCVLELFLITGHSENHLALKIKSMTLAKVQYLQKYQKTLKETWSYL